ncbi:MAG TPA: PfkB family carbohydrate kinase [Gemmataceae bacterium]|nr:PfkB family carbohydrate kinase [Gemmataceae bacterium]
MTDAARWDMLGLGCVAVDDLLYLDAFPQPDTKTRVRGRERQCGGLTGNALVAAARLGARCAFAGTLGTDEASHFVLDAFQREGIDISSVRIEADARPIRSTILVDQSRQTRTVLFDLSGTRGAAPDWPPEAVLRDTRSIYIDHYGIEGMIRAARVAHDAGGTVLGDLERDEWPGFDDLLALVDHVVVNQAFASKRTGLDNPAAAAERFWDAGRQAVVVTCGAAGSWWLGQGALQARHQPAFTVDAVDTTGCGDVFHGAYAAALVKGLPLEERVRIASAAAALKATKAGGQGSPRWEEVTAFLGR